MVRWFYRGKKNVSVHTTAMANCDAFTEGKERFCSYHCDGLLEGQGQGQAQGKGKGL
jgi:hypothetical protein